MRRVDPKLYTRKYYLSEASGHEEYLKSKGSILEYRLIKMIKLIPSVKNKTVLDIGSGRGEIVFWSVNNGAKKSVGIDYSKSAIKLSNKILVSKPKKYRDRITFILMDAKKLEFKNKSFDVVITTEVLEHLYPEEQDQVFSEISRVMKDDGLLFIHTAPSKWFNDIFYKYWCYPVSSVLILINNIFTGNKYSYLTQPSEIRSYFHRVMHVNEPEYYSLNKLIKNNGFTGKIKTTNLTIEKPILTWKDNLFNFLVYLLPFSKYFPLNMLMGNDYYAVLKKR